MVRILIVDDEPLVVMTIRTLIEKMGAGYSVCETCSNGKEAFAYIEQNKDVDIVITDVDMPVMDGIELAQKISGGRHACSMLFLSAYQNFNYVRNAFQYGASDYILKTELDYAKLKKEIDKIVQQRKAAGLVAAEASTSASHEDCAHFFYIVGHTAVSDLPAGLDEMFRSCGLKTAFPFYLMIVRPCDNADLLLRFRSSLPEFMMNVCTLLRQCMSKSGGDVVGIEYNLYCCIACGPAELESAYRHFYDSAWTYFDLGFEKNISGMIGSFDSLVTEYKTVLSTCASYSRSVVRARRYIQEHFADKDVDLCAIADYAGVSKNHLSALFSKECGETVVEYLSKVRISSAKKMLMETDLRIFEVADRTGFSNVEVFCRVFKKVSGQSPSEIRQ